MAPPSTAPSVHSLDCFAFTVPDLGVAQRFYETFGLDVRRNGGTLELYTHGHAHRWGVIEETSGQTKKLQYLAFGCLEQELPAFERVFEARSIERCAPHPMAKNPGGLWIRHPDGFPVQIVAAGKCSPDQRSAPTPRATVPPGAGAAPSRSKVRPILPRRLSHVLLFTADVRRAVAFYETALGLRVTDRSGDVIAFLHGVHGSDHHLVAVAKSAGPGLHHPSWDVGSIDDVGSGMEQMLRAGYTGGWGVGRHVLGSNYFYYVRDPWGSYCEYSFDIDYVPKGLRWPSRDHGLEDSFYAWGPATPPDFITNFEIAGAPPATAH